MSPNQRIAAGTQATLGSDCIPVTSGPIPRRMRRNLESTIPSSVPRMIEIVKPTAARRNDPTMERWADPCWSCSTSDVQTADGLGSA